MKLENMAYDEERNQFMKTYLKLRQVVELGVKDTKLLLLLYSICTKKLQE